MADTVLQRAGALAGKLHSFYSPDARAMARELAAAMYHDLRLGEHKAPDALIDEMAEGLLEPLILEAASAYLKKERERVARLEKDQPEGARVLRLVGGNTIESA